jgi:hypothetical protein
MARTRVSQYVIEALVPTDAFSPSSITGCGVSQYVIEALVSGGERARVGQYVIEVLFTGNDEQTTPPEPPVGEAATHTWGYAV